MTRIDLIKKVRDATGYGLHDSLDVVNEIMGKWEEVLKLARANGLYLADLANVK